MRLFSTFVVVLICLSMPPRSSAQVSAPDMILVGGKIATIDSQNSIAEALAITRGRISSVGSTAQIRALAGSETRILDLAGRTVIPGLIDSHIHAIRDGLYYTTLLDWSEISDLAGALDSIRVAAQKAAPGTWIIVVGGWAKDQLREKRAPTPQELDTAAPDNPVFVQHLFDFAVLNSRALKTLEITAQTALPPAGQGAYRHQWAAHRHPHWRGKCINLWTAYG
jgi:predicted amidohydrolase YtcJ